MKNGMLVSAATLVACAGIAAAQPVVDGALGSDPYGTIIWTQNQPTSYGDNIAGASGTPGNPADVTTGVELKIPLAVLGNPNLGSGIKLTAFIVRDSNKNISNQVTGGLPSSYDTLRVGEPRTTNFGTIAGTQTLTIFPATEAVAPTINGQATEAEWAGKRVWVQNRGTTEGDNTNSGGTSANGTELDNMYAMVVGTDLYLFFGGNINNYNKLMVFFDTEAGGQNRLLNGNSTHSFSLLPRLSQSTPTATDGLVFEPGFEPERVFYIACGNGGDCYLDYVTVPTDPVTTPGVGTYIGNNAAPSADGTLTGGTATGDLAQLRMSINNSNILGVGSSTGASTPSTDIAVGSEIDGVYGTISGGRLYLLVTGNLQNNFNKLDLFFDVDPAGGQNQLIGTNCDIDFNGLNRMGNGGNGAPNGGAGLKFESDFAADYYINVTNGNDPVDMYINAGVLRSDGPRLNSGFMADYSSNNGGEKLTNNPVSLVGTSAEYQFFDQEGGVLTSNAGPRSMADWVPLQTPPVLPERNVVVTAEFANLVNASINNLNVLGVSGDVPPISVSGAGSVTTGIEISVDLLELGWDGFSPIKVAGFINSSGHDFVSNQVFGGLPTPNGQQSAPSLGEPSTIDFSLIEGTQYITVAPPAGGGLCEYDLNGDGNVDQGDVDCMIAAVAGDPSCVRTDSSVELDKNQDGNIDQGDVDVVVDVIAGGAAPGCS